MKDILLSGNGSPGDRAERSSNQLDEGFKCRRDNIVNMTTRAAAAGQIANSATVK